MTISAVVLTGPTASGKSTLAIDLARRFPFEIISVDSALVYRGLDIGTAKPDEQLLQQFPHQLVNIRDPLDPYSAADFRQDAIDCVQDIQGRGKIPLLVGGTMLYLKALKDGIAPLPVADPAIREKLVLQAEQQGWPAIHKKLQRFDPESAQRINPNDPQRLQRAMEVYELTGQTMSEHFKMHAEPCPFKLLEIAICPPNRQQLHADIASRFDQMLAMGLLAEVQALIDRGDLNESLPAIKAVGYRQVWAHLHGEIDFETMREKAIVATRQLAKRQFTWLRGWQGLHVLPKANFDQTLKIIQGTRILEIS